MSKKPLLETATARPRSSHCLPLPVKPSLRWGRLFHGKRYRNVRRTPGANYHEGQFADCVSIFTEYARAESLAFPSVSREGQMTQARAPDPTGLERYRHYLELLARLHVQPRFR